MYPLPKRQRPCIFMAGLLSLALSACATVPAPQPQALVLWGVRKDGRQLYVLNSDFLFCYRKTGDILRVPRGFTTDFASIPSALRGILKEDGPYAQAAILHDYLYAVGEPGREQYANDVLLQAMIDYKVPALQRSAIFTGVELFRQAGNIGYGLPGDWVFYDPQTQSRMKPPKKPVSVVYRRSEPGCAAFRSGDSNWAFGGVRLRLW